MRKLASAAALCLLLAATACGGGIQLNPQVAPGSSSMTLSTQPIVQGALPELRETLAPEPVDIDRALSDAARRAPQAMAKRTSAVVYTYTNQTATATSPGVGGTAHDYMPKTGLNWSEAQDTTVDPEYHVTGTVNSINLLGDGISYATIGLTNWFNYDYSINQQGQSQYMFNQSVYLLIRRVAADPAGRYRVLLCDSNGRYAASEFAGVTVPFDFDLRLVPTNPIMSVPGAPPYTSHQCGVADLTIGTTPLGATLSYGNDNWGWRTAAGPEGFDAASGGAMLFGQVYSSGSAVTSTLNYDASFIAGSAVNPQSDNSEWFMRGRDRSRRGESRFNGPQGGGVGVPPGILWQTAPAGPCFVSSPVIAPDGTLHFGTAGQVHAYNPDGTIKPGWPYNIASGSVAVHSTPAIGADGSVYVACAGPPDPIIHALNPDGTLRWSALIPNSLTSWSGILEFDNKIYFTTANGPANGFYSFDTATGLAQTFSLLIGHSGINAPVLSPDGTTIYVNAGNQLLAFNLDGTPKWNLTMAGLVLDSPTVMAPDGAVFVGSGPGQINSVLDTGAAGVLNPAFAGTGFAAGSSGGSSHAIDDLGSGNYRIYTWDLSKQLNCFDQDGTLVWTSAMSADGLLAASPVIGADGKIYVLFLNGVCCLNPADGSTLWELPLPGMNYISPCLGPDGTLYVVSANGTLFAISDNTPVPLQIDARSLANASFSVFNGVGAPLTATLDTDAVYDASALGLGTGSQFYVQFSLDPVASPNDSVVYPPRPDNQANGLITVNAASLTIPASLAPYFTNPPGTRSLVLNPNAYNRVTNDLRALDSSGSALQDMSNNLVFVSGGLTDQSNIRQAVLAAGLNYRVMLNTVGYPISGSNPATLGAPEAVYPSNFAAGGLSVGFGTLTETGAVAGADNDHTDYYDQAGLVNTLQTDAFARCQTEAGMGLLAQYGLRDALTGTWIVVPGFPFGREPLAEPHDTFAVARGTSFQLSDGALFSSTVTVEAGKSFNGTVYPNSLPLMIGGGAIAVTPVPTRIADDTSSPDPGEPGTVTGTGPWIVALDMLVQFGTGPWTVELDADYGGAVADSGPGTPAAWNDGTPGRIYPGTPLPLAGTGLVSSGANIPAVHGAGSYRFAVRVTDSLGARYTHVWPNNVVLGAAPVARNEWYHAGGNAAGTKQSAYVGPLLPGARTAQWITAVIGANANQNADPVLNAADSAFVSTGLLSGARFHGFSQSGAILSGWPYIEPSNTGTTRAAGCVGPDGTAYFPVGNGGAVTLQGVAAINPDGTSRWNFDAPVIGSTVHTDLACENGNIYLVVTHDTADLHNLYTLNANTGALVNVVDVGPAAPGAQVFSRGGFATNASGEVYYSGFDRLWALNPNGTIRYSVAYTAQPTFVNYGAPAIAPDGMVFIADGGGVRSYLDTGAGFLPNLSWGAGGNLAIPQHAGRVLAISDLGAGAYEVYAVRDNGANDFVIRYNSAGILLDASISAAADTTGLAMGSNGTVYWSAGSVVFGLNGGTLNAIWSYSAPGMTRGLAISSDNALVGSLDDGRVFRIKD